MIVVHLVYTIIIHFIYISPDILIHFIYIYIYIYMYKQEFVINLTVIIPKPIPNPTADNNLISLSIRRKNFGEGEIKGYYVV
jgi:hypothetical protein